MNWRLVFTAILAGAASAGCDHPDNPTFEYACDDSRNATVTYYKVPAPAHVRVVIGEETFELPHVVSASGARFSDGKITWWEHGGEAELLRGTTETECVELAP